MTEAELALFPIIPDVPDSGSLSVVFLEEFYLTLLSTIPYISDPFTCESDGEGSGGACQDDRPDTGMLYPRG